MRFHLIFQRVAIGLICIFVPGISSGAQQPPEQAIRVNVDRVNVGVVVTDASGKFVEGLRRENFRVFDNGVEQPITDFLAIEEPAQVVLLIEAGPAVYLLEGGHLQAAHALLDGLSAEDRVAVVRYAEAAQPLIDFTTDKQSAAGTFDALRFNLGFGSLNLSTSILQVLDWLTANTRVESNTKNVTTGKKTIVLLSSGVDTSAEKGFQDLQQRLKTSDVRILAVSLTGDLQNSGPARKSKNKSTSEKTAIAMQQFAEANALLKQIAEVTGGHAYFPANSKDFAAVFAEIAQNVRHEFSVAFAPPVNDGAVHTIEVRVVPSASQTLAQPTPLYRVDYRRAYLAPTSANP